VFCVEFFLSSSPATSAAPVVILLLPIAALEDGRELFEVTGLLSLYEEFVFIMGPPPAPKEESSFIFFIDKFEY